MDTRDYIKDGKAVIGIEFGSTRIKAVLIGEDHTPIASGFHDWQNSFDNGIWTYPLDEVKEGLRDCFAGLMSDTEKKYGVKLTSAAGMGISAMMHGYLVFDAEGNQLVPFRTWRNTMTAEAADRLTEAFDFNIPQRWSVAHLYQAILSGEAHVNRIAFMTTLAGYVHWLLTGNKVIGAGDASGIFPIDPVTCSYDSELLKRFDRMTSGSQFKKKLADILPEIVPAGECAGKLTEDGARLLDPTGSFTSGVSFCPPEGDAQTGMVATNSILPRTGNVSAGTSIFSMIVLEKPLRNVHREIDIVTTPDGDPVAMVHCNSCTTDLDAWFSLFGSMLERFGKSVPKSELYDTLYAMASEGEEDCGGITAYNFYAGEPVTGLQNGVPMVIRRPDSAFTPENFLRSLVYSCVASLKTGMDILTRQEQVCIERICAHGGLFKTPVPSQLILASALGADVTLNSAAGEGGAWGIALLAAYMARRSVGETLASYLGERVFAGMKGNTVSPSETDTAGMDRYMKEYVSCLAAERALNDNI